MTSTLGLGAPVKAPPRRPSKGGPVAPRRRRPGRRVVVSVLLGVTLGVAAVLWWPSASSPTPTAESFAVARAYSVTYEVTAAGSSPTTERLWVRRPFDSVDITYAGSTPSLVVVYRLGVQVLKAASAQPGLLHIPAGAPPQDVRADVVIPAAVRTHRAKVVGRSLVLGRSCQVFRTAVPLRAGALPPLRAGSTYVDTCIDRAGIVLQETQLRDGHRVSDRRAVDVKTGDDAVSGASFDLAGLPTPFDSGGGAFTPLTLTSRPPGGSWELQHVPAGFQHLGRFAAVPPQPQLFGQGGNGYGSMALPGGLVSEMDDVYVRGADFLVLQQGSTLNGATFSPPANSFGVDLGPLGAGQLLIAGNATAVAAEPGNHKGFVRLSGSLASDELISLMRGLDKLPGGTLTRLSRTDAAGGAG